jgi:hypothetical protein
MYLAFLFRGLLRLVEELQGGIVDDSVDTKREVLLLHKLGFALDICKRHGEKRLLPRFGWEAVLVCCMGKVLVDDKVESAHLASHGRASIAKLWRGTPGRTRGPASGGEVGVARIQDGDTDLSEGVVDGFRVVDFQPAKGFDIDTDNDGVAVEDPSEIGILGDRGTKDRSTASGLEFIRIP